jgi:hypothetical protein
MTSPEPTGSTSWFNKPLKRLTEIQRRQDAVIERLRQCTARQRDLRAMERSFAARIPRTDAQGAVSR